MVYCSGLHRDDQPVARIYPGHRLAGGWRKGYRPRAGATGSCDAEAEQANESGLHHGLDAIPRSGLAQTTTVRTSQFVGGRLQAQQQGKELQQRAVTAWESLRPSGPRRPPRYRSPWKRFRSDDPPRQERSKPIPAPPDGSPIQSAASPRRKWGSRARPGCVAFAGRCRPVRKVRRTSCHARVPGRSALPMAMLQLHGQEVAREDRRL